MNNIPRFLASGDLWEDIVFHSGVMCTNSSVRITFCQIINKQKHQISVFIYRKQCRWETDDTNFFFPTLNVAYHSDTRLNFTLLAKCQFYDKLIQVMFFISFFDEQIFFFFFQIFVLKVILQFSLFLLLFLSLIFCLFCFLFGQIIEFQLLSLICIQCCQRMTLNEISIKKFPILAAKQCTFNIIIIPIVAKKKRNNTHTHTKRAHIQG